MRILSTRFVKLLSPSYSMPVSLHLHHHHHHHHHRHHLHTYTQYHNQQRDDSSSSSSSIIVIMGATGTGKTKLSIDIATRLRSEIINSDKIQVYTGLDITTNKVPVPDRRGVPHHLLGSVDPSAGELTASDFRSLASSAIDSVLRRRRIPVIAGGSNSFIHALVADSYDPKSDPFGRAGGGSQHRFRYRCCFIWVDVDRTVLREYLDQRVDEMVGSGMVEELEGYFRNNKNNNNNRGRGREWEKNVGLNKAIGVPEFEGYFGKRATYEEAVKAIKENTWRLAEEQVRKIRRLGECGWDLRRVDATGAVRAKLEEYSGGSHREQVEGRWGRDVLGPAMGAVEKFLEVAEDRRLIMHPAASACSSSSY